MRAIIAAIALLALLGCAGNSTIPKEVRDLKGKSVGGINLVQKYCDFETTSSSSSVLVFMYFPCKNFTIAVTRSTQTVVNVFEGKK